MKNAIRVLQAADLNLHKPLQSVGQLPAPQRKIFNQARERAALSLFRTAIRQQVDVLLLTGTLADFSAEPRLSCFLLDQFRQLKDAGVCVVGAADRFSDVPNWLLEPETVCCLSPGQSQSVQCHPEAQRIHFHFIQDHDSSRKLAGTQDGSAQNPVISISRSGHRQAMTLTAYHGNQSSTHNIVPFHQTGPDDPVTSGMILIEVIGNASPQMTIVPCPVVTWFNESIELSDHESRESLLTEMARISHRHTSETTAELICESWTLTGASPLWDDLVTEIPADRLLQEVRQQEKSDPRLWTTSIQLQPADEQFQHWAEFRPLEVALHQLERVSTADLAAAASVPSFADGIVRGAALTHHELTRHRVRLARELRPAVGAGGISLYH